MSKKIKRRICRLIDREFKLKRKLAKETPWLFVFDACEKASIIRSICKYVSFK